MAFRGGAFGKSLGHEGSLMNGVSAIIGRPQRDAWSLLHARGTARRRPYMNQEAALNRHRISWQRADSHFLWLCFIWALEGLGDTHPHWRGGSSQSSDSDANLFQTHRHVLKSCFTSCLGIPEPSQVEPQYYHDTANLCLSCVLQPPCGSEGERVSHLTVLLEWSWKEPTRHRKREPDAGEGKTSQGTVSHCGILGKPSGCPVQGPWYLAVDIFGQLPHARYTRCFLWLVPRTLQMCSY